MGLLSWLSGRRQTAASDAPAPDGPPSADPAPVAGRPAAPAWRDLPPVQRTVPDTALMIDPDGFRGSLGSWRDTSFHTPLGHLVSPQAPSGLGHGLLSAAGSGAATGPTVSRQAEGTPAGGGAPAAARQVEMVWPRGGTRTGAPVPVQRAGTSLVSAHPPRTPTEALHQLPAVQPPPTQLPPADVDVPPAELPPAEVPSSAGPAAEALHGELPEPADPGAGLPSPTALAEEPTAPTEIPAARREPVESSSGNTVTHLVQRDTDPVPEPSRTHRSGAQPPVQRAVDPEEGAAAPAGPAPEPSAARHAPVQGATGTASGPGTGRPVPDAATTEPVRPIGEPVQRVLDPGGHAPEAVRPDAGRAAAVQGGAAPAPAPVQRTGQAGRQPAEPARRASTPGRPAPEPVQRTTDPARTAPEPVERTPDPGWSKAPEPVRPTSDPGPRAAAPVQRAPHPDRSPHQPVRPVPVQRAADTDRPEPAPVQRAPWTARPAAEPEAPTGGPDTFRRPHFGLGEPLTALPPTAQRTPAAGPGTTAPHVAAPDSAALDGGAPDVAVPDAAAPDGGDPEPGASPPVAQRQASDGDGAGGEPPTGEDGGTDPGEGSAPLLGDDPLVLRTDSGPLPDTTAQSPEPAGPQAPGAQPPPTGGAAVPERPVWAPVPLQRAEADGTPVRAAPVPSGAVRVAPLVAQRSVPLFSGVRPPQDGSSPAVPATAPAAVPVRWTAGAAESASAPGPGPASDAGPAGHAVQRSAAGTPTRPGPRTGAGRGPGTAPDRSAPAGTAVWQRTMAPTFTGGAAASGPVVPPAMDGTRSAPGAVPPGPGSPPRVQRSAAGAPRPAVLPGAPPAPVVPVPFPGAGAPSRAGVPSPPVTAGLLDAGAVAVAAGVAQRMADGSVVFPPPAVPYAAVQRDADTDGGTPTEPPPESSPEPVPEPASEPSSGAGSAPEPASEGAGSGQQSAPEAGGEGGGKGPGGKGGAPAVTDELVRALYPPLSRMLKADLRLERERGGFLIDTRH